MITNITSKRHFIKFYLTIFGCVTFLLGVALIFGTNDNEDISKVKEIIGVAISASLVFLAYYTIVRYYQNAPIIEVDDKSITFNHSEKYFWKDLEKIELTGKKPFKFMGETKEATTLKFTGQQERYFFDDMYANSPEIKFFIKQVVVDKKPYANLEDINADKPNVTDESFVYFNGYQLLCYEGILFWFFLLTGLFIVVKLIAKLNISGAISFLILTTIVPIVCLRRLFYFGLSADNLIIKIHNILPYKRIYLLSDIHEIVFEQRHNMPVSLRVITSDFQSKLYPAGTLGSKKWLQLKEDLEKKNIKVRNECVSYEPFRFKLFS